MRLAIKNLLPSTIEAFGPFSVYHFSRGLTLTINSGQATLKGGPELEKIYDLPQYSEPTPLNCPPDCWPLIDRIEQEIGIRLIATASNFPPKSPTQGAPQVRTAFRLDDSYISADYLAEALLAKFQTLEFHSRNLMINRVDRGQLSNAAEIVAFAIDQIRDGHIGTTELNEHIVKMKSLGLPIEEAFLLSNAKNFADAARDAILRACYHFANMTTHLHKANSQSINSYFPNTYQNVPHEIVHTAEVTDYISNEFASSVISCYSSLDLLYDWFVYLTRVPFGKPDFPKNLHFPDDPGKAFISGGHANQSDLGVEDAPYAIPNLPPNTFLGLRRLRNDLVHNMAHDQSRSRIRIGIGLPPVNNVALQYSQYITRDTDPMGNPANHLWVQSFYKDQNDAQHRLHDWITITWQSIFDTTEWLANRALKM